MDPTVRPDITLPESHTFSTVALGRLHAADERAARGQLGNLVQDLQGHPSVLQIQDTAVKAAVGIEASGLQMEAVQEDFRADGLAGIAERNGGIRKQAVARFPAKDEDIRHWQALLQQEGGLSAGNGVRHGGETGLQGRKGLFGSRYVNIVEPIASAAG